MRKLLIGCLMIILSSNLFSQTELEKFLLPNADDEYLMKLSDLRFLRVKAMTPITTIKKDSIANQILFIFDNVMTDRPYDMFMIIELPSKKFKKHRIIQHISFIYKIEENVIDSKIYYMSYFPHEIPNKRFIGGVIYKDKFEAYFKSTLYYDKKWNN